jgi:phosphoribosylformylglycinamidine synthase subunit PurS
VKATVYVRLKREVLDPQGDAIKRALATLGFEGVRDVRVGKLIEIELAGGADAAALEASLGKMAEELLANPVIEDHQVELGAADRDERAKGGGSSEQK